MHLEETRFSPDGLGPAFWTHGAATGCQWGVGAEGAGGRRCLWTLESARGARPPWVRGERPSASPGGASAPVALLCSVLSLRGLVPGGRLRRCKQLSSVDVPFCEAAPSARLLGKEEARPWKLLTSLV